MASLQVISVDVPQYDSQFAAAKTSNFELLNRVLGGVTHTIRHVGDPLDLLGAFKSKEYSATAYYAGPLRIADAMTIKVKVASPPCLSVLAADICETPFNAACTCPMSKMCLVSSSSSDG